MYSFGITGLCPTLFKTMRQFSQFLALCEARESDPFACNNISTHVRTELGVLIPPAPYWVLNIGHHVYWASVLYQEIPPSSAMRVLICHNIERLVWNVGLL